MKLQAIKQSVPVLEESTMTQVDKWARGNDIWAMAVIRR